jgi:ElaB/YqjD/DUF883 family membrane-anchored ribosome-binding protein
MADIEKSINDIAASATPVVDRLAQSAHEAVDRVAAKAGPAVERLRSTASGAAGTLQQKAGDLGALEEQWMENARTVVRDNPLAAIAVAVAAGMLLSKLAR